MDLGLVFYRNRIGMSFPCKECGLVVLNCFQNHFLKRINMQFPSLIYFLCSSDIASEVCSFEHLIKTMQRMHYGKANIRTNVALQEMPFD